MNRIPVKRILFYSLLLCSGVAKGQVPIDTTRSGPVYVVVSHPDFYRPANLYFNVQYSGGTFLMTDSVAAKDWHIFHKSDSLRANAFYPNKPDCVSTWSPWTKIALTGPPPVISDIPFTFHPINLLDQGVTITKQRGTARKTVVDYYSATNLLAMFGANYPTDTTGFWFYKSCDRSGNLTIDIYAKGEQLNVTIGSTNIPVSLTNSYKHYIISTTVARGVNKFKFWAINESVVFSDPCFMVRWSDQGSPNAPASVGVHR